ncbi:amino acid ABC transporter permease [Methanococcus maripaludis]|uniref:Inner membrane amino-acid ABC transporter permease protein YecS n=1 Tax=Methanococcus maripaludis TaxID=39152 RepID=A0A2L1C8Z1_METMI|nr:amino acid ABC transporter permease [Methanococcus maripaludis]AVB75851.1 Inner membrane amino-acid ABC transporter permease protein YecS [Methanococcus maripaludis]MBA2864268.1 polar amino acid transport system permease protein [Methanococcus maripaludis]MBB6497194.1 polar amino acid transport system permease protein [Methanococcus maripaludis]
MKFYIVFDNIPFIIDAVFVTLKITIMSFLLSVIIAVLVGSIRAMNFSKTLDLVLMAYVEVFRGTPLLIQLFFIYYGLPSVGITMSGTFAAVLGLSLNGGAYISEIIRAAIQSVPVGQFEAAESLGMGKIESMVYIVLPQAFRITIPPLVNSFSSILKESSLISVLAITELTRIGQLIYTRTSRPFEIYLTIGLIYLLLVSIISISSWKIEKKLNGAFER